MLLIKLLNSSRNFLTLLGIATFLCLSVIAEEKSVDIWSNKNSTKSTEYNKKKNIVNEEKKIDISKINQKKLEEIQISDKKDIETPVQLIGLYDPGQNDLSLEMWSGTNGDLIRESLKRIEKINLSKFSEQIFLNTILTYSYSPQKNLTD